MRGKKLNLNMILGLFLTLAILIPVIIGIFWLPYGVNEMNSELINSPPSFKHLFGTDNFGRDIFSRVIEGAGTTFAIALGTVSVGALIGTIIGALTGYYGGAVDELLMRFNDALASFPSILLALVVVSVLDKGTMNIVIALGVVFIPSFARIMRSEFRSERGKDYVLNAKLMGAGNLRIIFVHIFPNTLPILGSTFLVGVNNAVLAEAGLSYLGLGVQPPEPSLGRMLAEAQPYIFSAPWYVLSTGVVMVCVILGVTLIGENFGASGGNVKRIKSRIKKLSKAMKKADTGENDADAAGEDNSVSEDILRVENLKVSFIDDNAVDETINGISFSLRKSEMLGIVGESGSGKSLMSLAIMGLLPEKATVSGGSILYMGRDLTELSEAEYCRLRGRKLAMIFQEPMTSLNPLLTIGKQIDEVLEIHAVELSDDEQRERVVKALEDTGLHEVDKLYDMYPHQLSGGMRQRVMIAMALIAKAEIIIADEPTTALDANIQDVILKLIKKINRKYGTSVILISHDLRVIGTVCDRALVMQDGRLVEELDVNETDAGSQEYFSKPSTEYGCRLLDAAFSTERPFAGKNTVETERESVVVLKNANVFYKDRSNKLFGRGTKRQVNFDIGLEIRKGEIVGLVGESGCGKSTLLKAIAGLQKYTEGSFDIRCEQPAMVFQDPYSSLNPAKKVGWILEEPLKIKGKYNKSARQQKIRKILESIELEPEILDRKVSELSGGQRQRIAIALTIVLKRDLILLDEPVSALDVTIQEQILRLLAKVKEKYGLTYVFISHDDRLIRRVCDRVFVMESGRIINEIIIKQPE